MDAERGRDAESQGKTAAILEAPALSAAGFRHGFSLRGSSAADLARHLGVAGGLSEAKQVHGARILDATAQGDHGAASDEEADALITRAGGGAVAIKVADCVPIVVASGVGVGAIHAGWRGLVAGVIGNALDALRGAGDERAHDVRAAIGPCIGVCCFEVGDEVATEIARVTDASVIDRTRGPKPHVDLRRAARLRLVASGVRDDAIEDIQGCTRCDAVRFHSYRRDGANAGRHRIAIARPR